MSEEILNEIKKIKEDHIWTCHCYDRAIDSLIDRVTDLETKLTILMVPFERWGLLEMSTLLSNRLYPKGY